MFNGIWLVAKEPLTVQGRDVQAGEQFHISRIHSGALLVTGRATILHPQPPPKSRVVAPPAPEPPAPRRRRRSQKTTVDTPAETPEVIPETSESEVFEGVDLSKPEDEMPRRRYQRRDLEAEE